MLTKIALWWCYITGGALAWGGTVLVLWWAFDTTITRIGWTKLFLQWRWDELKKRRGRVLATKSDIP